MSLAKSVDRGVRHDFADALDPSCARFFWALGVWRIARIHKPVQIRCTYSASRWHISRTSRNEATASKALTLCKLWHSTCPHVHSVVPRIFILCVGISTRFANGRGFIPRPLHFIAPYYHSASKFRAFHPRFIYNPAACEALLRSEDLMPITRREALLSATMLAAAGLPAMADAFPDAKKSPRRRAGIRRRAPNGGESDRAAFVPFRF